MRSIKIDKYLISAFVERWRPKTNSFHLPIGEMTITLQDISCLWGLPISGKLIVGQYDGNWSDMIERYLGIPPEDQEMKKKKRKKEDDTFALSYARYSITLSKLRDRFRVMPNSVPAMYLQFMDNLATHTEYNWGGAVLAMLYRQLNNGAEKARSEIFGPLVLLQFRSWSRLPLGRPKNIIQRTDEVEEQEEEESDGYPIFGAKWCSYHEFPTPHNCEFHYPERVMRQFGRKQLIPPPPPHGEVELRKLRKVKHVGGKVCDWNKFHAKYVQQYDGIEATIVQEDCPFDAASLKEYRCWFQANGMFAVFFDSQCLGGLENSIPYPRDNMEWTGYMPSGPPLARIGLREIKNAAWGIKCCITNGCKKIGKSILITCQGNIRDLNLEYKLQNMLSEAGLPIKVEEIQSDDDGTTACTPSPPNESSVDVFDEWMISGKGFSRYIDLGVETTNRVPTTQDTSQVTQCLENEDLVASREASAPLHPGERTSSHSESSIQVVD
ncbi:hypothetical protein OsJ_22042 [Oryza sativa Japonica Group]|uniref:Aminotransferase-like plant mobile domain-containing protein n=1 Tax=Oryza sativa subsp. japonica TaxID=39947 RepID=A3BDR1_ORYSJ|nr:hypothetical protein OsJ_22042 [Oryza sativa Japonica Group]